LRTMEGHALNESFWFKLIWVVLAERIY